MLSAMDLVELEVLRMMSAPPAPVRLFPSRTISSAPRSRIILSFSGECEIAMVSKPAAFAYCTARCPSPPIPSTATRSCGCGSGPAEPAINGIPGAKDRRGLLVGNLVRNQVRGVGVHQHVLGVTALRLAPRALQVGAEHSPAALAPFAATTGRLNPCGAHAVAYLANGYIRRSGDDLAHWLVAKDSR